VTLGLGVTHARTQRRLGVSTDRASARTETSYSLPLTRRGSWTYGAGFVALSSPTKRTPKRAQPISRPYAEPSSSVSASLFSTSHLRCPDRIVRKDGCCLPEVARSDEESLRRWSGVASRGGASRDAVKTTQAQAIDIGVQRAQTEHAIALLLESCVLVFTSPAPLVTSLPSIPFGAPSELLERSQTSRLPNGVWRQPMRKSGSPKLRSFPRSH